MDPNEDSDLNSDLESKYNLPLKISFIILLLIAISGLSYIFIFSKTSNKKITTNKITPTITPISPTPVSPTISPIKVEYEGKIIEINTHIISPIPDFNNVGFSFKLELNEEAAKNPSTVFFDKNELSYIKVIDPSGKNISYKDLKVGQNIKMIRLYNLNTKLNGGFEIIIIN